MISNKIYVPNLDNTHCYEFIDTVILREYETINVGQQNNYIDYNTSNHYTKKTGSQLLEVAPVCINQEDLTNDFYYRNDLSHVLIIFLVFFLFIIYIPFKLIMRFYGRGR